MACVDFDFIQINSLLSRVEKIELISTSFTYYVHKKNTQKDKIYPSKEPIF